MSDYGNLMEENLRLKAEIERLKAELEEAQKLPAPGEAVIPTPWEGADAE